MLKKFLNIFILCSVVFSVYLIFNIKNEKQDRLDSDLAKESMINELYNNENNNIEKMINTINTNTEIIVMKESGNITLNHSEYDAEWNKWLTESKINLEFNYLAIVSIPSSEINLENDNGVVTVTYSTDSFNVTAVDITNRYIDSERSLFGKVYTDDEKFAIEEFIKQEIKHEMMTNKYIDSYSKSLNQFISNIANELNVKVIFK